GYLLKQIRGRDLLAALEAVGRGESLLDPAVTEKVLERIRRIATGTFTDDLAQLTAQERRILALVAEGQTNKEIATQVFLSDKTVKNYVSSILAKLNLQRRGSGCGIRGPPPLPRRRVGRRRQPIGPALALGRLLAPQIASPSTDNSRRNAPPHSMRTSTGLGRDREAPRRTRHDGKIVLGAARRGSRDESGIKSRRPSSAGADAHAVAPP
ncbi:MAG TPA: response regulator transcription factor, partial [Verrucomicrobiae bacterium]|nr:response regulator transcription factor [Verrucomicrobiae bacterium]